MKRLITLASIGALATTMLAQNSSPTGQAQNNNQNQPQVQMAPQGQGQAPNTTPNPSGAAAGSQQPGNSPQVSGGASQTATPAPSKPATGGEQNGASAVPDQTSQPAKQPTTEILPEGKALPSADPIMEPGELPKGTLTLLGGRATKVDRVRNRVTMQPFGGGKKVTVRFDERSHIYRDGRETTIANVKEGDRVYADTQLVGPYIFARSIRVQSTSGPAEARGQVTQYDEKTGRVTMTDQLTSQPVYFTISRQTSFKGQGNETASAADVRPGAILDVQFAPGSGKSGEATEVALLAKPGANYVFAGRVTNLDLRSGVVSVDNQTDGKNYDLVFDPARVQGREQLRVGSEITARATFDGKNYRASDVTVSAASEQSAQQ